ncbi:DNA independent RNA polymerase I transcription factor, partial [Coemansia guatemalensis]
KLFAYSRRASPLTASAYAEAVSPWIPALSANVSALSIAYRELVSTVFNSDWLVNPDEQFVHRYATLVLQITSAHPAWVPQAIAALVRWFGYGARKLEADDAPRVHNRVHSLVREIYRAIPTCGSSLVAALDECWPFRKAKVSMQALFVRNTLRCLEYADSVRREVLRMVLNHIIQIDVEVQVELEDLESDSEGDDDYDGGVDAGGDKDHGEDGVFQFEEGDDGSRTAGAATNTAADSDVEQNNGSGSESDAASDTESDSDSSSESDSGSDSDSVLGGTGDPAKARNNAKKTVAKLDALISTLLTWLERHAPASPETDEQSEAAS